jgi:hypothetical protein
MALKHEIEKESSLKVLEHKNSRLVRNGETLPEILNYLQMFH